MAFENSAFLRDHLVQDMYLPEHPRSMAFSEPAGLSISLPNIMARPQHSAPRDSYLYTPRSMATYPIYVPTFPSHTYRGEESYTISSASTSARGRSGSEASTASAGYMFTSPRTAPTSPYSLSGAGSQYLPAYNGYTIDFESPGGGASVLAPQQVSHLDTLAHQTQNGMALIAEQSISNNRTYCPHPQCLDENGKPKKFFSRKADVTRHYKSQHDITFIDCPKKHCERKGNHGFTRRDHLTEHLRGFHMEKIAKRHTAKPVKNGNASDSEPSSPEDLEDADEIVRPPNSYSTSSIKLEKRLKRGSTSSNDFAGEDGVAEDQQHSAQAKRVKVEARQSTSSMSALPLCRRPERRPEQPQQYSTSSTNCLVPRSTTMGPEFVGSPPSPVYHDHHAMIESYATGHVSPPPYEQHEMNHFYHHGSMTPSYPDAQATHRPAYHMEDVHDYQYQNMHRP